MTILDVKQFLKKGRDFPNFIFHKHLENRMEIKAAAVAVQE